MLRLLFSILSIFVVQALDFQDALKVSKWTLKAAHYGVSKHIDISWEDVNQIRDHYNTHRPMQIRNTSKQWSVDHAFNFLLRHGQDFKDASAKAQPMGFDFKGTLHGVQYKLKCTDRCRVQRLGDRVDRLGDTYKNDVTYNEWLRHQEYMNDNYINRTVLRHSHVNMLKESSPHSCDQACVAGEKCRNGACQKDCHPADSVVRVQHPCDTGTCVSPRRMDKLKIGDMAESTPGVFEPIIAFSHRDSDSSANYYDFVANNRTTLHISNGHYLYANKQLTLPKDVEIGDIVNEDETITDIRRSFKQGLFHPHTWSAKLVVDGVQTSCNTDYIELNIQDYVTSPLFYVCYKLGVPIDLVPTSRLYKKQAYAKIVSSWFDGLRSYLSHTFVAPFLEIFFGACLVPMLLFWIFPETLAVVAMGYYVYKQNKSKKAV